MSRYIFAYGAQIAACRIWRSLGRCRNVRAEQFVLPLFFIFKIDVHEMGPMHHGVVRVSSFFEAVSRQPTKSRNLDD
jgi:hypothetical protein